jgi:hypothetical protein
MVDYLATDDADLTAPEVVKVLNEANIQIITIDGLIKMLG